MAGVVCLVLCGLRLEAQQLDSTGAAAGTPRAAATSEVAGSVVPRLVQFSGEVKDAFGKPASGTVGYLGSRPAELWPEARAVRPQWLSGPTGLSSPNAGLGELVACSSGLRCRHRLPLQWPEVSCLTNACDPRSDCVEAVFRMADHTGTGLFYRPHGRLPARIWP